MTGAVVKVDESSIFAMALFFSRMKIVSGRQVPKYYNMCDTLII